MASALRHNGTAQWKKNRNLRKLHSKFTLRAEIKVIQAQATADAQVTQAKAEAEAIELRGNAEAQAINARGKALRDNPALVALTQAEKWDGKLPIQMIPASSLPIIGVGK